LTSPSSRGRRWRWQCPRGKIEARAESPRDCYNKIIFVQLKKRELANFIDQQVKSGHFPSPEAAVEAAVEQMMLA
jgi:hypothetical protein